MIPGLVAAVALAGWFGPSDYQECVKAYATKAPSTAVLQAIGRACATWFDPSAHRILRDRAACAAKGMAGVQFEGGAALVIASCEREHPAPSCPRQQAFQFATGQCEWTCPANQRYDADTHACQWDCPPGWTGDDATGLCVPPQANVFDQFD